MDALTAGARLADARLSGEPIGWFPGAPTNEREANAVQRAVHAKLAASRLGRRIGWKVGCTTPVMRDYLGIDSPCAGGLFAGSAHENGAVLRYDGYRRVGVECEIAVAFQDDWRAGTRPDRDALAASLAFAATAIEIVDDRYSDWSKLGAPLLIADDFFAAGHMIGERRGPTTLPNLAGVRGETLIDGVAVGSGFGRDVMGHPLDAAGWLVERFGLAAGELVLTGSLVKTVWVDPGATVTARIDGLGEAVVRFVA